jgi:hypothetical protein
VGKHSAAERDCPEHQCVVGTKGPGEVNSFHSLRTVSSISYGVGVAGLATGVVLWLISSPDATEAPRARALEPWSDARSVGVRGNF